MDQVSNAHAIRHADTGDHAAPGQLLESLGTASLFGVAVFTQWSIAIAQSLLFVAIVSWAALVLIRRERIVVPAFFYPLLAYAGWTLLSAVFSSDPRVSLIDCKQLVLLLIVPATYRLVNGSRDAALLTVIMSVGAAAAAYGIFQYGLLHYDQLSQRPQVCPLGLGLGGRCRLVSAIRVQRYQLRPRQYGSSRQSRPPCGSQRACMLPWPD